MYLSVFVKALCWGVSCSLSEYQLFHFCVVSSTFSNIAHILFTDHYFTKSHISLGSALEQPCLQTSCSNRNRTFLIKKQIILVGAYGYHVFYVFSPWVSFYLLLIIRQNRLTLLKHLKPLIVEFWSQCKQYIFKKGWFSGSFLSHDTH